MWQSIVILLFAPTPMKNSSLVYLSNKLTQLIQATSGPLYTAHGCGYFDGGCHTLAYSIAKYYRGTEIFHISRSSNLRDHSVCYFPKFNLYFDADGFQTREELFIKMKEVEITNCNVLLPFTDFAPSELVFEEIHELILLTLQSIE